MNYIIEKFDSVTSMINKVAVRKNNEIMRHKNSSQNKDEVSWYGTSSYEQAVDFATRGYDKPLDALKKRCSQGRSKKHNGKEMQKR